MKAKPVSHRKLGLMKKLALFLMLLGCETDARVASRNLSKAADMFEIPRRIVFYNGITNDYILKISGYCSINHNSNQLEVTCKTGPSEFKKHFLGLSDNVTYFSEQVESAKASADYYRVIFKPRTIIPAIEVR